MFNNEIAAQVKWLMVFNQELLFYKNFNNAKYKLAGIKSKKIKSETLEEKTYVLIFFFQHYLKSQERKIVIVENKM